MPFNSSDVLLALVIFSIFSILTSSETETWVGLKPNSEELLATTSTFDLSGNLAFSAVSELIGVLGFSVWVFSALFWASAVDAGWADEVALGISGVLTLRADADEVFGGELFFVLSFGVCVTEGEVDGEIEGVGLAEVVFRSVVGCGFEGEGKDKPNLSSVWFLSCF